MARYRIGDSLLREPDYRLPERGAHTALGDVETVADLLQQVLRPLAEARGLMTWDAPCAYASQPWFPSRIAFGKYKGRLFQDARARLADLEAEAAREHQAEAVGADYQQARAETRRDYERAAAEASARQELSDADARELRTLFRKLVRLYHPDRFAHDPAKQAHL